MSQIKLDMAAGMVKEAEGILTGECKDLRTTLHREIVINALKCRRDNLDILDLKIFNRVAAEFRYAARVFKPYRNVRKVSIFGSARTFEDTPYYDMAREFGRLLAQRGFMVITGAAEGIMKAGIEGSGTANSFGVNVLLPFENKPADIIRDDPKLVQFKYFFTRKLFFVMEADAFALFPGGFGTHDEGFEVLTLLQTGKAQPMPVVLMELPGDNYWQTWKQFIKSQLLAKGFVRPEDLSFYKIVHSPEEGVEVIMDYYSIYHSMRQVQDNLVIRLEKELPDASIRMLNASFRDIIKAGEITKTSALPNEEDEPSLWIKPRITFLYNKKSAGRLNEMILMINRLGHSI
ncbi:MAG: TIGR00730 family Rossman fold protein [Dehalococcoidales bacterium]